ncbi:glycoside hydrolase family 10 protein [Pedobacter glucosidilyticus]|uniref:glycoside hydrolase family 10 protein n=1 Tax=Pedobacter glucosidilyticus TaxID=1122941 RepID=UPI00040CCB54|nr:family 10 glycosylhydrolase [Pedobacter glucosidilyticus]
MNKRYNLLLPILFFLLGGKLVAQQTPKTEFRAVWVATVKNIDWPSKPGLHSSSQQEELIKLFDEHEKNGMNAIFLQVRPSADALYAKSNEPWTMFLSGKQGLAPEPFYDPLAFAIAEAHKRGMELHAWFNPYRATNDLDTANVSSNHLLYKKPDWFFTYGTKKYFNPGLPEVRDYITKIITNVVRNYDVDGVHFDDYFYPYPDKQAMPDSLTFKAYPRGIMTIDDWRRDNVDLLIKQVSDSLRAIQPYLKFGISPSGIYRNMKEDPQGSETTGFQHYSQLYADSKKWLQQGWIDYINPQIYFPFNYAPAAYEKLVDWWAKNAFGKHVYIGHGVYRLVEDKNGWNDKQQMPNQIRYLRNNPHIQGSVFFSSKSVTHNLGGFQDSLRQNFYKYKAIPPVMTWLSDTAPSAPEHLIAKKEKGKIILSWKSANQMGVSSSVRKYVLYQFDKKEEIDLGNPAKIIKVIWAPANQIELHINKRKKHQYILTALNFNNRESKPSNIINK